MNVILLNIAADTRYIELAEIIFPVLNGGLFSAEGEVKGMNLFEVKDKNTGEIEYHGIVQIEPEAVALRVIQELDGLMFNEQRITVRQYHYRDWHNDRRDETRAAPANFTEKRKPRNRRRNLETIGTPSFFQAAYAH